MSVNKIIHGQYYTIRNPFTHELFHQWLTNFNYSDMNFVEPFAGSNNIVKLVNDAVPDIHLSQWSSYDIEPEAITINQVPELRLHKRDTILFPVNADVVITNPPYLAKNSAKRRGLNLDFHGYQDLYEIAVEKILSHSKFVAAIIPESFLTRKLFRERLYGFISITDNLFDDTSFPVGLALWNDKPTDDYVVYVGEHRLGNFQDVKKNTSLFSLPNNNLLQVKFNEPYGMLGVFALDGTKEANIRFCVGDNISSDEVKSSSRHITRFHVMDEFNNMIIDENNVEQVVGELNRILFNFREETYDIFMTSFQGIRKDGFYRRRLDYALAKKIIRSVNYQDIQ